MDPVLGISNGGSFSFVNANGVTQWMKGTDSLRSQGAVQLANGDLVLLSNSRYLGVPGIQPFDGNFVLTRISQSGTVQWTKAYGNGHSDNAEYIHLLPNGNIEVIGASEEYLGGDPDCFRARISPNGVLLEMKFQSSMNVNYGNAFDYDPATGNTYIMSQGFAGTFYVKCVDSTFNIAWEYHFTGNFCPAACIRFLSSGKLMIVGSGGATSSAVSKAYALCLSTSGSILWSKYYDTGGTCGFSSVSELPSGDIVFSGSTNAYTPYTYQGNYEYRTAMVLTDSNGNPLKCTIYGQEVMAVPSNVFAKNDSAIYCIAQHGLLKPHDGFLFLRLDTTLSNPTFCYQAGTLSTQALSFSSAPYASTYTIGYDTVSAISESSYFQNIPVSNVTTCPTLTHIYDCDSKKGRAVTATSDSCFVFAGLEGGGMGMTKYDPNGHIVWSKNYDIVSPYDNEVSYRIIEAANGDLLVGTGSSSLSNGGHACILRTDTDGNPIWCTDKSVGGNEVSYVSDMDETPDAHIIGIAGLQQGNFPTVARFALIKYDAAGNSVWSKSYANVQSFDGGVDSDSTGISACGNSVSTAYAFRTDTGGTVLWSKEISNTGSGSRVILKFAEHCPNGDIIFAGTMTDGSSSTIVKPYIVRFDSSGNLIWHYVYQCGPEQSSGVVGFVPLSGDQYLVTVNSSQGSSGTLRSYNFRINPSGNVIWARFTGPTANGGIEYCQGAIGYDSCIAFPVNEVVSFNYHFRFEKYSAEGNGPCTSTSATVLPSIPSTVTVSNATLSAYPAILTESSLAVVTYEDSVARDFVCSTPDTGFYYMVGLEEMFAAVPPAHSHKTFPVPTSQSINVDGFYPGSQSVVEIFDMTGTLVYRSISVASGAGIHEINVSMLAAGAYCLTVTNEKTPDFSRSLFILQSR